MMKKIFYTAICLATIVSILLSFSSCGAKASGIGVSSSVTKKEYFPEEDYSTAVITVDVTNLNNGYVLTACSVKLSFKDALGAVLDTKTVVFTDIHVKPGERDSFYAVYTPEDTAEVIKGDFVSVSSEPVSMTLQSGF